MRDTEALRAYRRSLELNPSVAVANYGLASVLFRQGQYEDAAKFISTQQTFTVLPGSPCCRVL